MRCRLGRAATGHFGGQRASLYSCIVPVPAGVAVPCSLPGLVAHALPAGCVAAGHFGGQRASPAVLAAGCFFQEKFRRKAEKHRSATIIISGGAPGETLERRDAER